MNDKQKPVISERKRPQQIRSQQLVSKILEAAGRVLAREGSTRFTSARVAEEAEISIGSLYQYFPNKAAILFKLQTNEWIETTNLLNNIIMDVKRPPLDRLHTLVHSFIKSECDEAKMRIALNDAAPLYRDAPEAEEIRALSNQTLELFMQELLPNTTETKRKLVKDLIMSTLSAVGQDFSRSERTPAEITDYAGAMSDMFCSYLKNLNNKV